MRLKIQFAKNHGGVLKATITKEMAIFSRYIPNLVGTILQLAIRVIFFLFFSGFTTYNGQALLSGKDLFLFFGAALLLYTFYSTAIWAPLNSVTNDLYNGTLEYIYITPSSKFLYYFGTGLSNVLINMLFFIPMFVFISIYSGAGLKNILLILACSLTGILNCISIGVMISLLGIVWKQVGSITGILAVLFEFLAGAYAPVQQYPEVIKWFAYALPFTWGYDLARHYLLGGVWHTLAPVPVEWAVYLGMAVCYTCISVILMGRVQKKVMCSGLNVI
jgi:ABC-2 type transport system permease protein